MALHISQSLYHDTAADIRTYSQLLFGTNAPKAKYANAGCHRLKSNVLVSGSLQVNGARGARSERTYNDTRQ
jgi:hypothetical protein